MFIENNKINDVLVIKINGSIDSVNAPGISENINSNIAEGSVKLVADFSDVDYTSSAGLRVLLGAAKETRSRNGDLRLANIRPEVGKVLHMSGFSNILKIFPDTDSAVKSYS